MMLKQNAAGNYKEGWANDDEHSPINYLIEENKRLRHCLNLAAHMYVNWRRK